VLFFKSVPHVIKGENIERVEFFNFKLFQESLVAYMNIEDVSAFEYFDEKNKDRVSLVGVQLHEQKKSLSTVKDSLTLLEQTIEAGARKMGKGGDDEEERNKELQKVILVESWLFFSLFLYQYLYLTYSW
jgi:hypothetical protein